MSNEKAAGLTASHIARACSLKSGFTYLPMGTALSNPDRTQVFDWTITPNCANPPCTTRIESSGDWTARAAFVHGRYRWTRVLRGLYFCEIGDERTEIDATGEYVVKPTVMRNVDGAWVVTRFSGEATFTGHEVAAARHGSRFHVSSCVICCCPVPSSVGLS